MQRKPVFESDPFTLGVASGEPSADGFVLWTRLAPKPLDGGGLGPEPIEVSYEIAEDESMRRIVQHGSVVAVADLAHSVHVEVEGLKANRQYWYRFQAGDAVSPIGRTRTAPTPEEKPSSFRFAFASCQHYEHGYYTAYQHMLNDDLDLIVHLGDYIYEGAAVKDKVRAHIGPEATTLPLYRNRYALYRTDHHLAEAHRLHPWLVTWDDHEFDNNCAGDISEEAHVKVEDYLVRRAAAYQAYYEHMPLRKKQLPTGPHMQLYRTVKFGSLAEFQVLDTRQYRSDQPNGDGNKPLTGDVHSPHATVLGKDQEQWLFDSLSRSTSTWNILAQQIMMARVDRVPGENDAFSMDQWAGYDVPRTRLLQSLSDRKVANPVVLTGDIHSNWVNDLKVNFDDEKGPVVATEFVGTSISSGGDGVEKSKDTDGILAENPFVRFQNNERGYVRCTLNDREWKSDYCVIPKITIPGGERVVRAGFVVEAGKAGAQRA
ncbi:MAG: alkaline phosphatase D family protein [Pirellulales bacterium]